MLPQRVKFVLLPLYQNSNTKESLLFAIIWTAFLFLAAKPMIASTISDPDYWTVRSPWKNYITIKINKHETNFAKDAAAKKIFTSDAAADHSFFNDGFLGAGRRKELRSK